MSKNFFAASNDALAEKIRESFNSVMPILVIVCTLCFTAVPVGTDILLCFILGTLMVVVGMGLFSLGADISMSPIGNKVGAALTKTQNLGFILIVSFILGVAVTVAEPDLQVLAATVPHINSMVLLISVGVGVGFFLALCMLRVILGINLKMLLTVFYILLFILAFFSDRNFLSVAFDSGGVTTGPMTVPFILAMGVGVSHIRSDKRAEEDSFGMVALCSVGPVFAVLILGFLYSNQNVTAEINRAAFGMTTDIGYAYIKSIPSYMSEISVSLLPIFIVFVVFSIFSVKMPMKNFLKICIGIIYTYAGLVLFLTGVNIGFSPLGFVLGESIMLSEFPFFTVPLAMVLGWFIISAEPAVAVLEKQIEEVSAGAIPGKLVKRFLSIAISLAMGISMIRIFTGISIMYFLIPGYAISLILSFFVPDIYTAVAFDSGGVASGPMTSTFMLQFAIGACTAMGGNVLTDAFGIVAVVAMMPLISIQILGLAGVLKNRKIVKNEIKYDDLEIVELWGNESV